MSYLARTLGALFIALGGLFVVDAFITKSKPVSIWPEFALGIVLLTIGVIPFLIEKVLSETKQKGRDSSPQHQMDKSVEPVGPS